MGTDTLHSNIKKLGVNGFGRIGKLTLWHHVGRKYYDEIIVNIGRQPGSSLEDIAHYFERDSTYGWLHGYLHGHRAKPVISNLDEESGSMRVDGLKVRFLRSHPEVVDEQYAQPAGDGRQGAELRIGAQGRLRRGVGQPGGPLLALEVGAQQPRRRQHRRRRQNAHNLNHPIRPHLFLVSPTRGKPRR